MRCFRSYKEEDEFEDDLMSESEDDDDAPLDKHQSIDYENTDGIDRILDFRVDKVGS